MRFQAPDTINHLNARPLKRLLPMMLRSSSNRALSSTSAVTCLLRQRPFQRLDDRAMAAGAA